MKTDNIKVINKPNDTFLKPSCDYDVNSKKVSFSFDLFQPESVKNERITYNGYYLNKESSMNAVNDFFQRAKELSKYTIGGLLSDRHLKQEFHLNPIVKPNHINRIETVLKDSYNFPKDKIEEFDNQYYEYQISDGKRVIWYKVDNVIHPLFIDCNHMICIDSSRSVKAKMFYSIKSSFSHLSEIDINQPELELKTIIEMILDSNKNGELLTVEDIVDILKESINYK